MFELFSEDARKVMGMAWAVALRTKTGYIDSSHIMLAVLEDNSFCAVRILVHLGIDMSKLRPGVETILTRGTDTSQPSQIPFSPASKALIEGASAAAAEMMHGEITTCHFLLADLGYPAGVLKRALQGLDVEPHALRTRILKVHSESEWP